MVHNIFPLHLNKTMSPYHKFTFCQHLMQALNVTSLVSSGDLICTSYVTLENKGPEYQYQLLIRNVIDITYNVLSCSCNVPHNS